MDLLSFLLEVPEEQVQHQRHTQRGSAMGHPGVPWMHPPAPWATTRAVLPPLATALLSRTQPPGQEWMLSLSGIPGISKERFRRFHEQNCSWVVAWMSSLSFKILRHSCVREVKF